MINAKNGKRKQIPLRSATWNIKYKALQFQALTSLRNRDLEIEITLITITLGMQSDFGASVKT